MKNLILLVFTPADLEALPKAVKSLKALPVESLWVIHSPQLGLPYPQTAKEIDAEIELCERDKRRAALAENFDDAKKYKSQIDALKVRRDVEIRAGFKAFTSSQLQEIYDTAFASLTPESTGIKNILREATADPLTPDQAFAYLESQVRLNAWVDQFPHGEYSVSWIRALPEPEILATSQEPPDLSTADGLAAMPFFALQKMAREAGVENATGLKKPDLIAALLAKHEITA
jgi:hypothetical protein